MARGISHDGLVVVRSPVDVRTTPTVVGTGAVTRLAGVAVVVMVQDAVGGVMTAVFNEGGVEAGTGESDNLLGMEKGIRETVLRSLTTATWDGCPDERPDSLAVCPV